MHIEEIRKRCEALAETDKVRGRTGRVLDRVIELLDRGELRVAEPDAEGNWTTNAWVKRAILLYFQRRAIERMDLGNPFRVLDQFLSEEVAVGKNRDQRAKGSRCSSGIRSP